MTPLHWAAYHDDADLVAFLLQKGAKQKLSKKNKSSGATGLAPVDLAGICGNKKTLGFFIDHLESKLDYEEEKGRNETDSNIEFKIASAKVQPLE